MQERTPIPPLLFALSAGAGWLVDRIIPLPLPLSFHARLATGLAVLLTAFAIAALALLEMIRSRTPFEPNSTPRALVTSGPFRFSRNPLYVSLVCAAVAFGILLDSIWVVTAAAVLAVLLNWRVIPIEESILARRFPEAFDAYRRRTRRWL